MEKLSGVDLTFLFAIIAALVVAYIAVRNKAKNPSPVLPNYDAPYEQGKRAAQTGAGLSNNKYDEGTPEYNDWIDGYHSVSH